MYRLFTESILYMQFEEELMPILFLLPTFTPVTGKGLFLLAIAVPAILHGLYDVFGWNLLGLFIMVASVFLLIYYLKKSKDSQSKLN